MPLMPTYSQLLRARLPSVVVAWLLSVAMACSGAVDVQQVERADEFARETIEVVRAEGLSSLRPRLDPATARDRDLAAKVAEMRSVLSPTTPDSVHLVSGEVNVDGSKTKTELVYHVFSGTVTSRVDIWIVERGGKQFVETLRVSEVMPPHN